MNKISLHDCCGSYPTAGVSWWGGGAAGGGCCGGWCCFSGVYVAAWRLSAAHNPKRKQTHEEILAASWAARSRYGREHMGGREVRMDVVPHSAKIIHYMILPDSVWAALQKPGWNQIKYILSAISRLYGLTETENKHTHSWQKKKWWLPVATIQSHLRRSEKSWNLYSGVHVVHQMTLTYFSDFRHSNTLKQIYSTVVIPASKIVSCYSLYAWIVFYSS